MSHASLPQRLEMLLKYRFDSAFRDISPARLSPSIGHFAEEGADCHQGILCQQRPNLLSRCRELTNARAYHFIGHRHIHIGDRSGNARVSPFG